MMWLLLSILSSCFCRWKSKLINHSRDLWRLSCAQHASVIAEISSSPGKRETDKTNNKPSSRCLCCELI
jgi:hypothetical protein